MDYLLVAEGVLAAVELARYHLFESWSGWLRVALIGVWLGLGIVLVTFVSYTEICVNHFIEEVVSNPHKPRT